MADLLPTRVTAIAVRPESIPVPEGKTERRDLRTTHSKTVLHAEKAADGKEIRTCEVRTGAVCYRDDDGQLRSIDTTIRNLDGEVGVDWSPYRFRLHSEGIGFDFFSRDGGWVGITLTGIGGEKVDQDTPLKPDIVDNTITFRDVRPGCDIVFKCLNQRVKTLRVLHDANAPRTFDWTVASDRPELIDSTLFGTDAAGNQLELTSELSGPGFGTYLVAETWTGKTKVILDPATRIRTLSDDVAYPVEIDPTVNSNPAVSGDDGMERVSTASWNAASASMTFGSVGAGYLYNAGIRFPNITVPQGATITSATLTLDANNVGGSGSAGTLSGRLAANPAAFDASNRPSNVTKTTATTAVARQNTTGSKDYDVTAILQELVNQVSFASGNAVALPFVSAETSGVHYTQWSAYDRGSGIPQLSITYTAAAGGTAGNLLLLGCG